MKTKIILDHQLNKHASGYKHVSVVVCLSTSIPIPDQFGRSASEFGEDQSQFAMFDCKMRSNSPSLDSLPKLL